MLYRVAWVLVLSIFVGGCTSDRASAPLAADHPANPDAAEAPIQPASLTLAAAGSAESAPATDESMPGESMPGMDHKGHDMGGMKNDMGDMKGMQHGSGGKKSMDHDMPGMKHGTSSSQPATTQAATLYTCRMHPEIVSDKPGKCPECGMKLVKQNKQEQP